MQHDFVPKEICDIRHEEVKALRDKVEKLYDLHNSIEKEINAKFNKIMVILLTTLLTLVVQLFLGLMKVVR